jgi:predicted  nucleic acid-binding Zn-ribbon protein
MSMEKCVTCEEWFRAGDGFTRWIGDDRVCLKCEGRAESDKEAETEIQNLRTALGELKANFVKERESHYDAVATGIKITEKKDAEILTLKAQITELKQENTDLWEEVNSRRTL